ncbi:phosphopantetheine-binding protein [Bailinhaonella thermotolerans]|uniref:Acyl carrier protein n=1 Tax=Bailinhaonella thermotolerans TaxID=1070861 RepID=A0A3A4AAS3_9ACTN|nr:phosphopantetheine-binding protein [Bailinhaonella thermotolerans]RJL23937.1 acyl carrier protein [Bailinhaonella thermotolerans]
MSEVTRRDIERTLHSIIARETRRPASAIYNNLDLEELGVQGQIADKVSREIERSLEVRMRQGDVERARTVGDLVTEVERQLRRRR